MELTHIEGKRVYFDTNIFIYALEYNKEYRPHISSLFTQIQKSDGFIITSELALAECFVRPFQNKDKLSIKHYEDNIKSSNIMSVVTISKNILKIAAENKATYNNKLPDAIHLATALEEECDIFITNDTNIKVPVVMEKLILKKLLVD